VNLKLKKIFDLCFDKNIPFVSYRYPGRISVHVRIQLSGKIIFTESIDDVIKKEGFVFAPFHRRTDFPVVFFEPEIVFTDDHIPDSIIPALEKLAVMYNATIETKPILTEKQIYLQQADKFINSLNFDFEKAILSRVLSEKKDDFSASDFFFKLTAAYGNAFCYIANIPGTGKWLGASPETLIRLDEKLAYLVSLAGTQANSGNDDIFWHQKEQEEQLIVTKYLESLLIQFGADQYDIGIPKTIEAGNLLHLSTKICFKKDKIIDQICEFINELHPSPAVCGLPKKEALDLILETEEHNREYYAGYLGTLNVDQRTDLFVNLRCMKILQDQLLLFVGGGLTKQSIPEKEWRETQMKAQTLLSLL
jgi:isochorismate synthase